MQKEDGSAHRQVNTLPPPQPDYTESGAALALSVYHNKGVFTTERKMKMKNYWDTTRADRKIIEQFVDPTMTNVDTASKLLARIWEDYFGMRDQEAIPKAEAEHLGRTILAILSMLDNAVSDYNFVVGHYDEYDLQHFTEYATRVIKTAEAEKAFDAALKAKCYSACNATQNLDNEEAIKILTAAVKEAQA